MPPAPAPVRSFPGRDHVYDVMVVGAGVAGSEAAWAAARAGRDVLLVTTSLDTVYNLVGDGASLAPPEGTLMAELAPPLEGGDGRVGTWALHRAAKYELEHQPGLHLLQSSVSGLLVESGAVAGARTWEGVDRRARRVALCVGSFLRARLRVGQLEETAGRLSEMAYDDLHDDLAGRGFAFEERRLEAGAAGGSLPYTVDCRVLAAAERDGFRLPRLAGLYAAGVCAGGGESYEAAAREGRRLGEELAAQQD